MGLGDEESGRRSGGGGKEQEQLSIDWTRKKICYAISVSLSVCLQYLP